MGTIATTRAARVQPFLRVLQDAGVDVERELARAHIPSIALWDPDVTLASHRICGLITKIARKEGIEDIALLGNDQDGWKALEPWVRTNLLGATTLDQLLVRYCRIAKLYIPHQKYAIARDARLVRICVTTDSLWENGDWLRLADWNNVLLLLKVIRHVLGQNFVPDAITLQSREPLTALQQERFCGSRILQGWTTNSISFPKHLLATPLPDVGCGAAKLGSSDALTAPSFPAQLRELIKPCLSENWLDVNAVAEMIGCSTRTFQRRLSASSLSFSELLDQTRMEVAKTMLVDERATVTNVGYDVGYSDPANFCRSFRRLNGMSPTQYRKSIVQQYAPSPN